MQNLGESGAQPGIFNHITQSFNAGLLGIDSGKAYMAAIANMDFFNLAGLGLQR